MNKKLAVLFNPRMLNKGLFVIFSSILCCLVSNLVHANANDGKSFVSIKNGGFYLNESPFFPVVCNYKVTMYFDGTELWSGPYSGYQSNISEGFRNKNLSLMEIKADFELIKKMGFNAVRIVGIGEQFANDSDFPRSSLFVNCKSMAGTDFKFVLSNYFNRQVYFSAISSVLDAAEEIGLKIIYLTRLVNELPETEQMFAQLCEQFEDNSTIMAFDYFNEPLYFDSLAREKETISTITDKWDSIISKHAPNHLSTIGLAGIREVFEWDPNLVTVDFISFHPYEYEPDQVRNEMYWYGSHVKKPWIIGETSFPADNDSVPYAAQTDFAKATLGQALACGAIGYSWWQYKDVNWSDFHSDYMGVVSREGHVISDTKKRVAGTPKPAAKVFSEFNHLGDKGECLCLDNYHNYLPGDSSKLKGKVVSDQGMPIQGAVIMAWSEDWMRLRHAVSKADGTFQLEGNFRFFHWIVGATLHTNQKGALKNTIKVNKLNKSIEEQDVWDIGQVVLSPLSNNKSPTIVED